MLLEEIRNQVKLIAEGHSVLNNKIDAIKDSLLELDHKVEETRTVVKETNKTLIEHIKQPAHTC